MLDGGRQASECSNGYLRRCRVVHHWRLNVLRQRGTAPARAFEKAEGARAPHEDAVAEQSPLLGQCGRALPPGPAADALHVGGRSSGRRGTSERCSDFTGVPVAVENVSSYAEFHASEMTEWEFLNEVVEQADLRNPARTWTTFTSRRKTTASIPTCISTPCLQERVAQIHIAGHTKFKKYLL